MTTMSDIPQLPIDELIKLLGTNDPVAPQFVVRALIDKGTAAVEPLIAAMKDSHPKIRSSAAMILGILADPRAVLPLIEALHDTDMWVQTWAAISLGQLGDKRAVQPLLEALKAGNMKAAEALAALRATEAIESLIETLDEEADDDEYADEALHFNRFNVRALAEFDDPRVIPTLIKALGSDYHKETEPAVYGLARFGEQAVQPLLDTLKNDTHIMRRINVINVFTETKSPLAVEPIIEIVRAESDEMLRHHAAIALGELGDTRAVDVLIEMLNTPDEWLRRHAAAALGELGDRRAVEPLKALLEVEGWQFNDVVREALRKLGAD